MATPTVDHWTILRVKYRSVEEYIIDTEMARMKYGLSGGCPVLDLLKAAPDRTIGDVLRAEYCLMLHPFIGPRYLMDCIATATWFNNWITASIIQRQAVAMLLNHHPQKKVMVLLQMLFNTPDLQILSIETIEAILVFMRDNHPNAKAWLAQPEVRRWIPEGVDVTDFPSNDILDWNFFGGGRVVIKGEAKDYAPSQPQTGAVDIHGIDADFANIKDVVSKGDTTITKWLREMSTTKDQTRWAPGDITAPMIIAAVREQEQAMLKAGKGPSPITADDDLQAITTSIDQASVGNAIDEHWTMLGIQAAFAWNQYIDEGRKDPDIESWRLQVALGHKLRVDYTRGMGVESNDQA